MASIVERAFQYAEDVRSCRILTNRYVKLAVERFFKDYEESQKEGSKYVFDADEADRFGKFAELLKLYKDDWSGQPLVLEPWQCFVFANIYGFKRRCDGTRKYRKAFLFVSRKCGKTTMMGTTLLWDLLYTNGAEGFIASTKREQSRILFDSIKQMVRQNAILSKRLKVYESTSRIVNLSNNGKIEALSSDTDKFDGLNPSCIVVDELAAQRNFDAIKILQSGQGSRPSPLLFEITSGSDILDSAGKQEWDRSSKILEGVYDDDSYFCMLYGLDKGDDWRDETKWIKACPMLGVTVKKDFLTKCCIEAQQQPSLEYEFRCKQCLEWLDNEHSWISSKAWKKARDNVKKFTFDHSIPYYANIAVDLSHRQDLTVATLTLYQNGKFFLKHFMYIPENSVDLRIKRENELWRKWIEEKQVHTTPTDTIDYEYMLNEIRKWSDEFKINEVLFDPWQSNPVITELSNDFEMVEINQSIKSISPYAKSFEEEVLNGNIVDDNKVMAWMVSNAMIVVDANSNIKVLKNDKVGKSTTNRHIDSVITSLMGVGRIRSLLDSNEIDLRTAEQIAEDTSAFLESLNF